jgi:hypothetical protein
MNAASGIAASAVRAMSGSGRQRRPRPAWHPAKVPVAVQRCGHQGGEIVDDITKFSSELLSAQPGPGNHFGHLPQSATLTALQA